MTTFESILYALVHSFTEFLPVSSSAHDSLLSAILGWPAPTDTLVAVFSASGALALFIYFRHDWASVFSSLIQIVVYRRYPMTLDERMSFFLALASAPVAAFVLYVAPALPEVAWSPMGMAAGLVVFGLIFLFTERWNRKNKGMFDWNWLDSLWVGLAQGIGVLPGVGFLTGSITAALLRNYRMEAAAKFALMSSFPVWVALSIARFRDVHAASGSWTGDLGALTFSAALLIGTLTALLAMATFTKQMNRRGIGAYAVYRIVLGLGMFAWAKFKTS